MLQQALSMYSYMKFINTTISAPFSSPSAQNSAEMQAISLHENLDDTNSS